MCGISGGGAPAQAPVTQAPAPAPKGDATQTGVAGAAGGGGSSIAALLAKLSESISAISQALTGSSILGGGAPPKGNPLQVPLQAALPPMPSNRFGGLPGSPAETHTGPVPAGVRPLPAPPSALTAIPTPDRAPSTNPDGSRVYWFKEPDGRVMNTNEATVKFYGLKPAT